MEEKKGFKKFLLSKFGRALVIIVFYCIFIGIAFAVVNATSGSSTPDWLLAVVFLFFGIFGWRALSKITPNIFLAMPVVGWLIYFVIKGMLSILIGVFVAPFVLSKAITNALLKNDNEQ